ncbi:DUF2179 domain-containing protein [Methanospirillum purgamenti]|uniref:UPF0316 protein KSK55_03305 n=1 Tax=Methanospirillum hungatei TaxID=2203 RepID=A0A8F5VNH8_METHU|nr:DUF2179 domain-containing protein [Methanospirillum hungatei]QXO95441.1 DUF2179 domain-containing protein [Methanospirillum hungatei]
MDIGFLSTDIFAFVVIPLLIFFARIVDVSIGTIRYIMISRGFKYIAPIFGFFEVTIWLLAIGQVMANITNPICYIAYGAGFASGTYIGMEIEERMKLGMAIIRLITPLPATDFVARLRQYGYGVTNISAEGANGQVTIIFMVVKRSKIPHLIPLIRDFNPHAFYTIEDVRSACEGIFPIEMNNDPFSVFKRPFYFIGKRK